MLCRAAVSKGVCVGRLAGPAPVRLLAAASSSGKKRPISPDVAIYAFPPTAISSISNRATGAGLSVAFASVGLISAAGGDVFSVISAIQTSAPVVVPAIKFSIAFPLIYHYVAGVRHLYWDGTAKGLDNVKETNSQSNIILGASVAAGLALSFVSF